MNKKLNNTKFARVLRRLFGEETGATMMEYVILAVMIAAAVTAAAIYFGNTTKNQMAVASTTMTGDVKVGAKASETTRETVASENAEAHKQAARFSNLDKGLTDTTGGGATK